MPAPFIPIPAVIGVRISATFGDFPNVMNNTLSFSAPEIGPSSADCAVVAAVVKNWVDNHYYNFVADEWTFTKIEAFDRGSQTGGYAVLNDNKAGASGPGTQPDAAPLFMLKTENRGRSHTGRFYSFAPDDASITVQAYTSTPILGMLTALGALRDAANDAGYPLCVASPTLGAMAGIVQNFTNSTRLTKMGSRRLAFGG